MKQETKTGYDAFKSLVESNREAAQARQEKTYGKEGLHTQGDHLGQLCLYDKRNPDCIYDDEEIKDHEDALIIKNQSCACDNCFYGRTKLAEEIVKAVNERKALLDDLKIMFDCYNSQTTLNHTNYAKIKDIVESMG